MFTGFYPVLLCLFQAKKVNLTVHAIVTTSDLEISPAQINFGYCTIYEAVQANVTLTNKSILPQEFGFVGLPEVCAYPHTHLSLYQNMLHCGNIVQWGRDSAEVWVNGLDAFQVTLRWEKCMSVRHQSPSHMKAAHYISGFLTFVYLVTNFLILPAKSYFNLFNNLMTENFLI